MNSPFRLFVSQQLRGTLQALDRAWDSGFRQSACPLKTAKQPSQKGSSAYHQFRIDRFYSWLLAYFRLPQQVFKITSGTTICALIPNVRCNIKAFINSSFLLLKRQYTKSPLFFPNRALTGIQFQTRSLPNFQTVMYLIPNTNPPTFRWPKGANLQPQPGGRGRPYDGRGRRRGWC